MSFLPKHDTQCCYGSGSKFFDLGQVGSIFCGLSQQSMVWIWVWKISTKNVKFFHFFPFVSKKSHCVGSKSSRAKGRPASYLLRVKSKLGSGQDPSLIIWQHTCSFFTYICKSTFMFHCWGEILFWRKLVWMIVQTQIFCQLLMSHL